VPGEVAAVSRHWRDAAGPQFPPPQVSTPFARFPLAPFRAQDRWVPSAHVPQLPGVPQGASGAPSGGEVVEELSLTGASGRVDALSRSAFGPESRNPSGRSASASVGVYLFGVAHANDQRTSTASVRWAIMTSC